MPQRTRTVTLTDRDPVTIAEADWPQIGRAEIGGDGPHDWMAATLVARRHADGRTLVYGVLRRFAAPRHRTGATIRAGEVVAAGGDVSDAVRMVTAELEERSGYDCRQLTRDALASLPARPLL